MVRTFSSALIGLALCLGTAAPVFAQDADISDWEHVNQNNGNTIAAYTQFDNGISLIVRCQNRANFDVLIGGLPEVRSRRRMLQVGVGQEAKMRDVSWLVGSAKTNAFSLFPTALARDLMRGGPIRIRVPGEDGQPATVYVMETEPSVSAIADTLSACNRPLSDPRDNRETEAVDELPLDIEWSRAPRPEPNDIVNVATHIETYVTVSCLTAEGGTLKDCRIESAFPHNAQINSVILNATRKGRLRVKQSREAPPLDLEIVYTVPIKIT